MYNVMNLKVQEITIFAGGFDCVLNQRRKMEQSINILTYLFTIKIEPMGTLFDDLSTNAVMVTCSQCISCSGATRKSLNF